MIFFFSDLPAYFVFAIALNAEHVFTFKGVWIVNASNVSVVVIWLYGSGLSCKNHSTIGEVAF